MFFDVINPQKKDIKSCEDKGLEMEVAFVNKFIKAI